MKYTITLCLAPGGLSQALRENGGDLNREGLENGGLLKKYVFRNLTFTEKKKHFSLCMMADYRQASKHTRPAEDWIKLHTLDKSISLRGYTLKKTKTKCVIPDT